MMARVPVEGLVVGCVRKPDLRVRISRVSNCYQHVDRCICHDIYCFASVRYIRTRQDRGGDLREEISSAIAASCQAKRSDRERVYQYVYNFRFTAVGLIVMWTTELGGVMLTPESIETATSDKKMTGSVLIMEAENINAVRNIVQNDIYYTSGVVSVLLYIITLRTDINDSGILKNW